MDNSYSKEFNGSGDSSGAEQLKKRHSPGSHSAEEIRKAVEQCLSSSSSTLDVSRKNIQHLTGEIYTVPSIKYFHLERNVISTIPKDLFQKLPHLVWLDLRYNKIKALPPEIGSHRQLKTLLLEKNPIKELPTELDDRYQEEDASVPAVLEALFSCSDGEIGTNLPAVAAVGGHRNLTSLTALNLRDCPLVFPPKDVIQKGLKSILCFLRDSGNGKLLCLEPATSETPPVEKLNLSELLQSSLDVSDEWPNEEEKLRFQKLKEEIVKAEKEEFLTDEHVGAAHDSTEAGKNNRKKEQLSSESAGLCSNKEMPQERRSQAMLMKEEKATCRLSPTNADTISQRKDTGTAHQTADTDDESRRGKTKRSIPSGNEESKTRH